MLYPHPERNDEMKLWQYGGKHVKIVTFGGQVFCGVAQDYVSELDNPDGVACISIGDIEFEESEIASIEYAAAIQKNLAIAV